MKEHSKEMTIFMEKCSQCHGLRHILSKRMSTEEWGKVVKIMAGKPHANISPEELILIERWIGFMQSAIFVGP